MLTIVVFMKAILATKNSREFYYDLIRRNAGLNSPHVDFQSYYLSIVYFLNLNKSPDELSLKKISIYGATNELSLNYLSGQLVQDENEFIGSILYCTLSILKAPGTIIEPYIKSALNLYERFDREKIPVF
jgi:hypothetical protein